MKTDVLAKEGRKLDRDGFESKLTDLLKTRMSPIPTGLDIKIVAVDGTDVCMITVPAEPGAHYLNNKLYVRFGNSTEELTGRDFAGLVGEEGKWQRLRIPRIV